MHYGNYFSFSSYLDLYHLHYTNSVHSEKTDNKPVWAFFFISNVPDLHEVLENANKNAQKQLLIID